jgi:hypothetical protein
MVPTPLSSLFLTASIMGLLVLFGCARNPPPPPVWSYYDACYATNPSFVTMVQCGKANRTASCDAGNNCTPTGNAFVQYADALALKKLPKLKPYESLLNIKRRYLVRSNETQPLLLPAWLPVRLAMAQGHGKKRKHRQLLLTLFGEVRRARSFSPVPAVQHSANTPIIWNIHLSRQRRWFEVPLMVDVSRPPPWGTLRALDRRRNYSDLFSGRLKRRCNGGDAATETALHVVTPLPCMSVMKRLTARAR